MAALDFMILEPVQETVITGIRKNPGSETVTGTSRDRRIYCPGERLSLGYCKKFHTTVENIVTTNELPGEQVKTGQRLLLVKEVGV